MASLQSNGAGPSRTASTTSSSTSINTIQWAAGPSSDTLSFPIVSSSLSSPVSPVVSGLWHLDEPTESLAGISFSPTSSATYTPPKKIATSPYTRQRAFRQKSQQRSLSPTNPRSGSASISLLENTLKLESLGVSSRIPDPLNAPSVTLSNRCRPDAKVIFDQIHFTDGFTHTAEEKRKSRQGQITGKADLTGIGEEDRESFQLSTISLPSHSSGLASARSSITLTSPTSTSSIIPTNTTVATSLTPDADSQSMTSTASSIPATNKKPAWSTPRSWAEMASAKSGHGTGTDSVLGAPFSENLNGTMYSPSQSSNGDFSQPQTSNGKGQKANRGPRGLEDILQHVETRFIAPLTYPRGMINKGNLCFANATLQVLIYCAPFYNLFRLVGEQVAHDFHNSTPLMEAVVYFLSEFKEVSAALQKSLLETPALAMDLLREIQASSEPFAPEYVYDAMKLNKRFDAMRRGHQEDAEEFLGFFLDTLHEELLVAVRSSNDKLNLKSKMGGAKPSINQKANGIVLDAEESIGEEMQREVERPISPTEGDGWLEVGQKGRTSFTRTTSTAHSPITRIFGGKLRSLLRMPGSKDSVTLEPYQPLQLDIQPNHVTTVEEALQNLTVPETITGVYSPSVKRPVDATKQVFIETLPPILILHLKRFVYDDIGGVQKSLKVLGYGPTLEISESTISPTKRGETKRRYKLFGVIYHHGRFASGGHYTVDVLKQDQSEWIHIDDTTWSPVSVPSVQAGCEGSGTKQHHDGLAYLLFYAREDVVLASKGKDTEGENITTAAAAFKFKQASAPIQSSKHQRVSSSTTSNKIQNSRR